MYRQRAITVIVTVVLIQNWQIWMTNALKCRTDDGPSDEEMKRIARSCMRKVSENEGYGNGNNGRGSNNNKNNNNNSQQNWNNNNQYGGSNSNSYNRRQEYDYDYNGDSYADEYSNNNQNDELKYLQRNRDHLQMKPRQGQIERISLTDNKRDEQNERRYGNGNHQNQQHQQQQQPQQQQHQHHRNNNQSNNNNNNNSSSGGSNGSHGNRNSSGGSQQQQDGSCVIHCFFQELNVLNNSDYPDKHKVLHVLTKDIRDRELRDFYADTIQECFHLLEIERRRDKCEFSKNLIHCMGEYAKANCDDWHEHSLIFN